MKPYDNILCVIPARAGSQGIIDKNLQLIHGIPLVEHSILHALGAGINPENIVVSSDSLDILDIALRNKVLSLERPDEISGSNSSTEEALLHALQGKLRAGSPNFGRSHIDHVLLLQPTSPIRFPSTVEGFLKFYLENDYDSALTATEFHDFFWYLEDEWKSTYSPNKRPMRQSISLKDNKLFDNGNMYLTSADILIAQKCRLGGKVGVYPISELEGMQIDTPEDLEIFRAIFSGKIAEKVGLA